MDQYTSILQDLLVKYETNEYIKGRLNTFITNLPELLDSENKKYEERLNKFNELVSEQDNFFKIFLSKHQYYYMPFNNLYYEYDDKTFKVVNEDDIYHKLLSTITDEGKLIQWKHKTKQMMIKKIKERLLVNAIPSSETIQNVLNFCNTFFKTKDESKYFLTIIGSIILKKESTNIFFVSSSFKKFLGLIDAVCYITCGNTIFKNIITKYHSTHYLNNYRLIRSLDTVDTISFDILKNMVNEISVDLLVVAAHYSEQYGSPSGYLNNYCNDNEVKDYILYFQNNSSDKIINEFINNCIEVTNIIDSKINWNNMKYIWKQYLLTINIPNMIDYDELQKELMKNIQYTNEENNVIFIGITSKYLPNVSSFLSFWDKYITVGNYNTEYEIDEIITMYKSSEYKTTSINDKTMINMINHYFDKNVEIIDNKYVTNINCILWNKDNDLNEFIEHYIETKKNKMTSSEETIGFADLYRKYVSYYKGKSIINKTTLLIVSKQYFENYLVANLSNSIKFDKFIYFNFLN